MNNIFFISITFSLIAFQGLIAQTNKPVWTVSDSVSDSYLVGFDCSSMDNYFAVYDSVNLVTKLRHTTDGGKTWYTMKWESRVNFNPIVYKFEPKSILHPTDSLFVMACDGGIIFRSENLGKSWDTIRLDVKGFVMATPMIKVSNEISLIGYGLQTYFISRDKCKTWQKMSLNDIADSLVLFETFSPNTQTIIMRVRNQVPQGAGRIQKFLISKDYGITWKHSELSEVKSLPTYILKHHFVTENIGFAVGREYLKPGNPMGPAYDIIYKTTDGGSTWIEKMRKENQRNFGLDGVGFLDSLNGVVVGISGKILRTIDGGETWKQEYVESYTGTVDLLSEVKFLTKDKAVMGSSNFGKFFVYRKDIARFETDYKDKEILVTPNPAKEYFIIKNRGKSSEYRITTGLGELIKTGEILEGNNKINLEGFASGVYYIRFRNSLEVKKIVVVK